MALESAVLPRLRAAREKLDSRDLAGAIATYEEVLASAGDRADVLTTISGDLGSTGHPGPIIELIGPRYDVERHGPAAGLNLLQAYLAVRNPEAAQHMLDMLFSLNRPELEDRLFGYSRAISEIITQIAVRGSAERTINDLQALGVDAEAAGEAAAAAPPAPTISMATISKPIWYYGLEEAAPGILPPKEGKLRRIAFAQLALTEVADPKAALEDPADELARLARGLPLWFAEAFTFSPLYAPVAAVGQREMPGGIRRPMVFSAEWTPDNLRQLLESSSEGLDYVFTGSVRQKAGDYDLTLRVWEMKKFRERKTFSVRWTPATADRELSALMAQVRQFMEWAPYPGSAGLRYAEPASPRAWADALQISLELFLATKGVIGKEALLPPGPALAALGPHAASSAAASLAWLTILSRALALELPADADFPPLAPDPVVGAAQAALGL
jgi:hypothetical protein